MVSMKKTNRLVNILGATLFGLTSMGVIGCVEKGETNLKSNKQVR